MSRNAGPCLCGDPECKRCFPQALVGHYPLCECFECRPYQEMTEAEIDAQVEQLLERDVPAELQRRYRNGG